MTAVWDHTPYEGGELLVLLALADWADDQGRCWPSVPAIAQKARLKERHVYNILQKFRADEIIQCEPGGGRGHSSVYLINTAKIAGFVSQKKTLHSTAEKPCTPVHTNPALECKSPKPPNRKNRHLTVSEPSANSEGSEVHHSPELLAQAVKEKLGLGGRQVTMCLVDICKAKLNGGADPTKLRIDLINAWTAYKAALGKLEWTYGSPEKFYASDKWHDSKLWPWKDGHPRRKIQAVGE
jgi:hypothetical protein